MAVVACSLLGSCTKSNDGSEAVPPDAVVPNGRDQVEGAATDCPHQATCKDVATRIELPDELAEARPLADKCLAGSDKDCRGVFRLLHHRAKTESDRKHAESVLRIPFCRSDARCKAGDLDGCAAALRLIPPLRHDPSNVRPRCLAHYSKKQCLGGRPRACAKLSRALESLESPRAATVRAHAINVLATSCDAGNDVHCTDLAEIYLYARKQGNRATFEYARRAAATAAKTCVDKRDADACSRAAKRYELGPLVDWEKAGTYYDAACKLRNGDATHADCQGAYRYGSSRPPANSGAPPAKKVLQPRVP